MFLALLLIFNVLKLWSYGSEIAGYDFYEKWEVGRSLARAEPRDVYSVRTLGSHVSTPFLYSLAALLSTQHFMSDLLTYRVFCFVSSVFAIICIGKLLGYSPAMTLAAAVVFTDLFEPLLSDVRVANVNQLQLGLLASFLLIKNGRRLPGHDFLSGLILGLAVMAKPNLLFVALMLTMYWLINRRFKVLVLECAGLAAGAATAVLTSRLVFGSYRCWFDWLAIMPKVSDYRYVVDQYNCSLAMLVRDWVGVKASAYLMGAFLVLATAFVWRSRRKPETVPTRANDDVNGGVLGEVLMVATGCLIYLLSATLVWLHYFVLTIPMALVVLSPPRMYSSGASVPIMKPILGAAAIFLIAERPVRMFLPITQPRHSALIICIGTLALFYMALWEIRSLRRGTSATH
jgi:hypothetical protein